MFSRKLAWIIVAMALILTILSFGMANAGNAEHCVKTGRNAYGSPTLTNQCYDTIHVKFCYTSNGIPMFTCPETGMVTLRGGKTTIIGGIQHKQSAYMLRVWACDNSSYVSGRCKF